MHLEGAARTVGHAIATAIGISLLQALHGQALAQQLPAGAAPGITPPAAILGISPNTGTSTLDQLRAPKSDSIELQFPSGFTCRTGGGDVPALVFYGDQGQLVAPVTGIAGLRAGMAVIIPLYKPKRSICDRSMALQDALSILEIAEKLVTSGAMTNEEYMALARRVKEQTLGLPRQTRQ